MTMTKEFITKMIAAKRLEYEALRELLPDSVRDNMDEIGAGIKEALMDYVREQYFSPSYGTAEKKTEAKKESHGSSESNRTGSAGSAESTGPKEDKKAGRKVRSVTIE